jgi:hypothetical protein
VPGLVETEPARDVLDGLLAQGIIDEVQHADSMALLQDRAAARRHYSDDFHPNRRAGDHWPWWVMTIWRNLVPLIALGFAVYAVANLQTDVDRQKEGRRVAVDVLCGGVQGVSEAGAEVLRGDLPGQRGRGLPERTVTAYQRQIAVAVVRQAGIDAKGIVRRDGSIDCDALRERSQAVGP